MAIQITNLGSSAAPDYENNADASAYANASWTPPTSGLILLAIYNTRATNLGSAGTVTGNGITWTQINTVGTDPGAQTHRITLYAANASGATTGQTTVDFAGDTQSSIVMMFAKATGVDLSGGVAAAFVQKPTNSANSGTSLSITLAAAGNSSNRVFACIGHGTGEAHTPRANYTGLDDVGGTSPGHGAMTEWRPDAFETTASASWTTTGANVGIAAELKELASDETSSPSDNVGITDSVAKAVGFVKTVSDTVGLTDTVTKVVDWARTIANTVGITDLVEAMKTSGAADWVYSINETVGITDTVNRAVDYIRTLANTVGITDSVLREIIHISKTTLKGMRDLYNTLRGKRDKDNTLSGGI